MRQTLEKRVLSILEDAFGKEVVSASNFDITFYELIREMEGWSVNSLWVMRSSSDVKTILSDARQRWEVYKVNYSPKARVCDLSDDDFGDVDCVHISHNHIPVFSIKINKI